jgi:hypothetical protein
MISLVGPIFRSNLASGSVLSIMFWAYKLGFDIGILERTWDWGRVDNFDSADEVA